mmetsp:Transcript_36248/g.36484  ORF Transcript_36248/g.36484 Transcript_36248/m.36484 type:complete len:135 (-) Transcript_36248:29-433(-)
MRTKNSLFLGVTVYSKPNKRLGILLCCLSLLNKKNDKNMQYRKTLPHTGISLTKCYQKNSVFRVLVIFYRKNQLVCVSFVFWRCTSLLFCLMERSKNTLSCIPGCASPKPIPQNIFWLRRTFALEWMSLQEGYH